MAVHIYIYYEYCLYIYGVLLPYGYMAITLHVGVHMNSWVLDEWLYYEILPNTTELKQNPYETKGKTSNVYEALTYYYETMTMASPTLHFQAVFQKNTNSPNTGYYTLFHS